MTSHPVEHLENRRLLSFGAIQPGFTNVNVTKLPGSQAEEAIAIDPLNTSQVFAASNNGGNGITANVSTDGGATWQTRVLGDGADGLPTAQSNAAIQFDSFGNLFLTYLHLPVNGAASIEILLSTDGGDSFAPLAHFDGNVDRPSVAVGDGSLWVAWNQGSAAFASGASVSGFGALGSFSTAELITPANVDVAGVTGISIGPAGQVMVAYQDAVQLQGPSNLYVATDPNGLAAGHAWQSTEVATTRVGYFYPIPADNRRTIDAEAGVAFDNSTGPFSGRAYLVYTDASVSNPADTDIFLRYSKDDGSTWSKAIRANNDRTRTSQFFPRVGVDNLTGDVVLTWLDCRNSAINQTVQTFAAIATPVAKGVVIGPNIQISTGTSNSATVDFNDLNQFGDYMGLNVIDSNFYPAWADNSDSTADNPEGPLSTFDVYTARIGIIQQKARPRVNVPDLAIGHIFSRAATVSAGATGNITVRVANRGSVGIQSTVPLQLFLSSDSTLDGVAAGLADRTLKLALRPHSAILIPFRITLPNNVPPGSYHLLARIDLNNLVPEANKQNNLLCASALTAVI